MEQTEKKNFAVPAYAAAALERLWNAGYEAYLVGGCVRDFLLGRIPGDFDLTTSALPEETKAVFSDCTVIETGIRHGTVTVLIQGFPLEITTYRVDTGYSDSRHPDSVTFTRSLREDAARRDFTVNAMAYCPGKGLMDFFEGQGDLEKKIIRCVGDPDKRFTEDALRILRALRFSAVLGFEIDAKTGEAIHRNRERLRLVSEERITAELMKLLCGVDAERILRQFADVFCVFLPELIPLRGFDQHSRYHIYDVYEHTIRAVAAAEPIPQLRLTALLHDVGKPRCFTLDEKGEGHFYGHSAVSAEMAAEILTRLKFDNAVRELVTKTIKVHCDQIEATEKGVKRGMNRLTPEVFFFLIKLMRADNGAQAPDLKERQTYYDDLERIGWEILAKEQCFSLKHLAVNGGDIMTLGVRQGKAVGEILKRLLDAVISDEVPNDREALLKLAEHWINKK